MSIIGDNVSDEDRVVYLLASLPESYDMLVTALEANAEVPDMETDIKRLLNEERKQSEKQVGSQMESKEEVMALRHRRQGPRCHFVTNLVIFNEIVENKLSLEQYLIKVVTNLVVEHSKYINKEDTQSGSIPFERSKVATQATATKLH